MTIWLLLGCLAIIELNIKLNKANRKIEELEPKKSTHTIRTYTHTNHKFNNKAWAESELAKNKGT